MAKQRPVDDGEGQRWLRSHWRVATIVAVPVALAATFVGVQLASSPVPLRPPTQGRVASGPGAPIVMGGSSASCLEQYGVATLKHRAFAFDGTVSTSAEMQPPADGSGALPGYRTVTFLVHEWFRGGGPTTIKVDMLAGPASGAASSVQGASFGVGTRLLVSGEPRFGGSPLKAPVAWGCGFTRSYEPATAAAWRS